MNRIHIYMVLLLALLTACDDNDENIIPPTNRTVILYLVADNSLSDYSIVNINELLRGTTKEKLNGGNLVVYVDNRKSKPKILHLKVNSMGKVVEKVVKTYKEQDSTDPAVMKKVLDDVVGAFPASRYGLVLWSHSSAWIPKDAEKMIATRSFGLDGGNEMEINTLKEVLSQSVKFEFILFDSCYMGSIEVAYELRNTTDYLIASAMEVLGKGYPYDQLVGKFFSMPNADVKGIAKEFYDYYNSKEGDWRTASVVVVDMKKIDGVANSVKNIMRSSKKPATVDLSKVQALEYYYSKRLLYDFDDYMGQLSGGEEYKAFQKALNEAIIYEAHTPTSYFDLIRKSLDIHKCCGLTVYPVGYTPALDAWYSQLDWYKAVH